MLRDATFLTQGIQLFSERSMFESKIGHKLNSPSVLEPQNYSWNLNINCKVLCKYKVRLSTAHYL